MDGEIPELIPARMLNEITYCPRLFWYEFVDGLFAESADTAAGSLKHKATDEPKRRAAPGAARERRLAAAPDSEGGDVVHTSAVSLSSERFGIIAKIDLLEAGPDGHVPIEYKRGRASRSQAEWSPQPLATEPPPPDGDAATEDAADGSGEPPLQAWAADLVQVAAQVLVLEDNGYRVPYAIISYLGSKTRVRVEVDDALRARAVGAVAEARALIAAGHRPPPLVDDARCDRCSLLPICMPEETAAAALLQTDLNDAAGDGTGAAGESDGPAPAIRRIIPARDDQGALYVNTQGATVGRSGDVLVVKKAGEVIGESGLLGLRQINIFGNVQITTQALQQAFRAGVPVAFFSAGGSFYGLAGGLPLKNITLRMQQFATFGDAQQCLVLARRVVVAKIANQRTLLLRNHADPGLPPHAARELQRLRRDATRAASMATLLGLEGLAARVYFEHFGACLKADQVGTFDFNGRNRRPPRDPVNALLSLAYAVLAKDLTVVLTNVGFDPMLGFFHRPRFGRPALALDLMEEFRPLIADSTVVGLINNRVLGPGDFLSHEGAAALTDRGRAKFFEAYERRKDTLVTHPTFGYRLSYQRMLEVQARMLARVIEGELPVYRGFTTR